MVPVSLFMLAWVVESHLYTELKQCSGPTSCCCLHLVSSAIPYCVCCKPWYNKTYTPGYCCNISLFPVVSEATDEKNICRFYNMRKGCHAGDNCPYQHIKYKGRKMPKYVVWSASQHHSTRTLQELTSFSTFECTTVHKHNSIAHYKLRVQYTNITV